ncbi:class D sortase [Peribacillus sp. SCS-155]|uniref:class D sortase n=1 Tax=Peribacillus sedimenti TaxID=3115297 RepID=UPI0039064976
MKKVIAILLLLSGIGTIGFPWIEQMYIDHKANQLIMEWEKNKDKYEPAKGSAVESLKELDIAFRNAANISETAEAAGNNVVKDATSSKNQKKSPLLVGTIKIKKIGLYLPVVEGAGPSELKNAAGHVRGTSMPGEPGNIAIAAHRSLTYGRFFNRLDEVEKGDTIILEGSKGVYTYKVIDKFVVKPTDLSVIAETKKRSLLTLITCHPIEVASHRLIIRAELK